MADNTGYTPGTGATIAADDVGGVLFQRVKLTAGTDGTATDLPGDATNGLDVDVTRMPDATTASGTLGALNAAVTVSMRGHAGASAQIAAGTLVGSLVVSASHDGGTTWIDTYWWDPAVGTSWGVVSFSVASIRWIAVPAGATHVRVRCDGYTSGNVAVVLSAADVPAQPLPSVQFNGSTSDLGMVTLVGGLSGSAVTALPIQASSPSSGAAGLVVRHAGTIPVTDNGGTLSVDDGAGAISVDDNGASLTVDDGSASLTVDAPVGTPVFVRLSDGAAAIATLPVSNTNLDVALSTRLKPADTLAGVTAVGSITNALPAGTNLIGAVKQSVGGSDVSASNPVPMYDVGRIVTYRGSAQTFRTPGRAGTAGQKIMSLHNATGSTVVVRVTKVTIDLAVTVIKAVTVLPPVIRLWKVTVLPTNGTALTKVSRDSSLTASGSVTVLGDASSDGTNSATALTATLPAGTVITQEYAPRMITAAGYEMFDRTEFLSDGEEVVLRALEGIVVFLDYTLATQNPTTDMWVAGMHWTEATS